MPNAELQALKAWTAEQEAQDPNWRKADTGWFVVYTEPRWRYARVVPQTRYADLSWQEAQHQAQLCIELDPVRARWEPQRTYWYLHRHEPWVLTDSGREVPVRGLAIGPQRG